MITVVGSLNMDIILQSKHIAAVGETVLAHRTEQAEGGKGANQAVAAARLGAEVNMIGAVGRDSLGNRLIDSLEKNKINTKDVKLSKEKTGIAFILVDEQGNNSITVFTGANFDLLAEDIEDRKNTLSNSKILLTQLETPLSTVKKSLTIAKKNNCLTILDPAPAQKLDRDILSLVDILTPNKNELEILSGESINNINDCMRAAKELLQKCGNILIVTLGKNGSLYIDRKGSQHFPAYPVKSLDSTAAGDCFNGALAAALNRDLDIKSAIDYASKAAAISVTRFGAQPSLPDSDDLSNFSSCYEE